MSEVKDQSIVGTPISNTTQWLKDLRQGFWRGQSFAHIDETLQKLLFAKFHAESENLAFNVDNFLTIYQDARDDYKAKTTVDMGDLPESMLLEPQNYHNTIEAIQLVQISTDTSIWHLLNNLWTERSLRKEDGQYFTPYAIKRFMCAIYPPTTDSKICDPCGGSGGFIIMASDMLPTIDSNKFYYYDADGDKIAKVAQKAFATYKHPLTSENLTGIHTATHNSLDDVWHGLMDRIYTNVPFGHKVTATTKSRSGHHLLQSYDVGKEKSSELSQLLFIEKCINQLEDGGLFATVVDKGIVTNRKYSRERAILAKKAALELVVELPGEAFEHFAGTTFPTFLLFFRKGAPSFTRYDKVENIGYSANSYHITDDFAGPFDSSLESVNYENCDLADIAQRWRNRQWPSNPDPEHDYPYTTTETGSWLWGQWRYEKVQSKRLRDIAHLVVTRWNGENLSNPTVDRKYRYVKETHLKPKSTSKIRALQMDCLLMSRLLSEHQTPACAVIPEKYHGAGCTNENYIIQPDCTRGALYWLATIWYLINFDKECHYYLWSHCRGQGRARIIADDLLAMPIRELTTAEMKIAKDLIDSLNKKRWVDEIIEQKLSTIQ